MYIFMETLDYPKHSSQYIRNLYTSSFLHNDKWIKVPRINYTIIGIPTTVLDVGEPFSG